MTVSVDAVMYCRIVDPVLSVTRVEDVTGASKLLGATTLRNVMGTKNMTELLSQRDDINSQMKVRRNGVKILLSFILSIKHKYKF